MRKITSPQAFKTSYIAEVKEEIGISLRKRTRARKVKTPEYLKPIIRKAIELLGEKAPYRDIQKKALEIYQEMYGGEIDKFYGALQITDKEAFKHLVEDAEIVYR